ncbi:hypothetical protein ZWY2020_024273 [Hordeum vulgare]|nr:hypothetical protein ZWY2020_024273 [Hordeum vulgare]
MVLSTLTSAASVPWSSLVWGTLGFVLLWQASRLVDLLWWQPRRLERALRAEGLRGTSYPFLVGDILDYRRRRQEAQSRSMPLRCHNIAHIIAPLLCDIVREHGKTYVYVLLMLPALSTCCEELVNRWTRSLGSDGTYELDVFPEFQRLTGDAISRTAFGSNYLEGARVFQLQSEQIERMVAGAMKIVLPGYLSLPSKNNRMMHQINSEIESILHGLIRKRMQAMQEGENTKNDVLGLMLESNMRTSGDNGQSISGMTIKEVVEECELFYLAGTETTSILLTWTMIVLSMHPEWQDRAREEVIGLFGKNKIEYEAVDRLKTVTMILYEVLRLYSPAVAFFRKTYKEIKIGSITYPAGVLIELPLLLMNHDPDIWGRDVHEFKPERFTNGISQASKNPGAFLPFSWGPRICIAQQFALLEAKVPFCMILQSFKFELATSYTHVVDNIRLMRPMHGAQINLRWDSDFV